MKHYRLSSALLFGLSLAPVAQAEEGAGINVTTAADSAKIGLEFRAEYNRDDNGFKKISGAATPDASSTFAVQTAKIKLAGNLNKNTEYKFRFNLLNPDPNNVMKGPLDYGV